MRARRRILTPVLVVTVVVALLVSCSPSQSNPGPVESTSLPSIKQVVFFGDSLTDAGTYGLRFTTMPGKTWAQHLAARLGQSEEPNEHVLSYADDVYVGKPGIPGPGGLNYAEGGARADQPYSVGTQDPQGAPISTAVQVQRFLDQHQRFEPGQLVTVWVGTNDVALNFDPRMNAVLAQGLRANVAPSAEVMGAERVRVQQAAQAEGRTVADIVAGGAQRVLVFKLFDLAVLPWFETAAARVYVHDLTNVYNDELLRSLPEDSRVHVLDTAAFVDDLLANEAKYGFIHGANEDACAQAGQDFCEPAGWKAPDADRTYVFAAAEHLTTHAHELLADYVWKQALQLGTM